jgi:hypothetical protein
LEHDGRQAVTYDPSDPRFQEPPRPSQSSPPAQTDSWSYLPVNQEPFPDRSGVERVEKILSFALGALVGGPAGFGVFVTLVHSDTVLGLDWATAAWIFIAASALASGFLLARVKTTLR